ncbi:MAG: hypothetical protein LBI42_09980 [Chitinispirillales bacterium]|jgi:hypothetical protein|nr:hypothetical protein [Chitinispirillales bacterium]
MIQEKYRVLPGPEGFITPSAAMMGVVLPDSGYSLVEGDIVPEAQAVELIANKLINAKNAVICPGPLLMWQWAESAAAKAAAVKELAETCGAKILPMPDYRQKRINPAAEISPNHPNVTIMNNNFDVCVFAGMHSHHANMALRLIRGGTSCYTIALCDYAACEEAMVSLRDVDAGKIKTITRKVNDMKRNSGYLPSRG